MRKENIMAKVYIVQENPNVNVIGAGRFGELISLRLG
tara:strand:- start:25 stop:135 length:111 start_codon:yes stop_codon:yes gene_type:complete